MRRRDDAQMNRCAVQKSCLENDTLLMDAEVKEGRDANEGLESALSQEFFLPSFTSTLNIQIRAPAGVEWRCHFTA